MSVVRTETGVQVTDEENNVMDYSIEDIDRTIAADQYAIDHIDDYITARLANLASEKALFQSYKDLYENP